jgi:putative serine protease PepD
VVGTDATTDVAVPEVEAPASLLHPLELGDSTRAEVGDGVVVIGSPFGPEESVTAGIVSALDRGTTAPDGVTIAGAIQTDAAINHGDSGGPLRDADGEVIGLNAQIASDSGGNDGVGFAIPSNAVRDVVAQLLSSGSVKHAYLGVAVATASAGAQVADVAAGTPAARAGPPRRRRHRKDRRKGREHQRRGARGDRVAPAGRCRRSHDCPCRQHAHAARHPGEPAP